MLKEAELAGGQRLAGVGARIVGEVFVGLLALDDDSYLSESPRWTPTLPSRVPGTFTTADLLTFAASIREAAANDELIEEIEQGIDVARVAAVSERRSNRADRTHTSFVRGAAKSFHNCAFPALGHRPGCLRECSP